MDHEVIIKEIVEFCCLFERRRYYGNQLKILVKSTVNHQLINLYQHFSN